MNTVYDNPVYLQEIKEALEIIQKKLGRNTNLMECYLALRENALKITNDRLKGAITCGTAANCSFCCHDRIEMGAIEAQYVEQAVKEKGVVPNQHRIKQQNENPNIKWMDKACPLLLDENSEGNRLCSIYEDRPLICIIHNSAEDPERCNKENDPGRSIREAKIAVLDALIFTSFGLGFKGVMSIKPTTMHEMLNDKF